MMLLSLGLILEHLVPNNTRRMDRVDHLCIWAIRCSVVILFLTLPHALVVDASGDASTDESMAASPEFFFACSGGKLDVVKTSIEEHPSEYNKNKKCQTCVAVNT
jgi:hypothetical protein